MTPVRRFAYRLALALGQPNPEAMLATMPYRIFTEWMRYAQVEPFGEERADMRAGIIASTTANSIIALINSLSKSKLRRTFKPIDFMPFARNVPGELERAEPSSQSKRHHQQVLAFMMAHGGQVVFKKEGEA